MDEFKNYHRIQVAEMRPYELGEDMAKVYVPDGYTPKEGDMIARSPRDRDDLWLVKKEEFESNFETMEQARKLPKREEF
jgi:hypothetical protein